MGEEALIVDGLEGLHGPEILLLPIPDALGDVIASEEVVGVVIFEVVASLLLFFEEDVQDDSNPEIEDKDGWVLSLEHECHADEEDDEYHNDGDVLIGLIEHSES